MFSDKVKWQLSCLNFVMALSACKQNNVHGNKLCLNAAGNLVLFASKWCLQATMVLYYGQTVMLLFMLAFPFHEVISFLKWHFNMIQKASNVLLYVGLHNKIAYYKLCFAKHPRTDWMTEWMTD